MRVIKRHPGMGKLQLAELIVGSGLEPPFVVAIIYKSDIKRKVQNAVITQGRVFVLVLPSGDVVVVVRYNKRKLYMSWRGKLENFLNELEEATYGKRASVVIRRFLLRHCDDTRFGFAGVVSAFKAAGIENAYSVLDVSFRE